MDVNKSCRGQVEKHRRLARRREMRSECEKGFPLSLRDRLEKNYSKKNTFKAISYYEHRAASFIPAPTTRLQRLKKKLYLFIYFLMKKNIENIEYRLKAGQNGKLRFGECGFTARFLSIQSPSFTHVPPAQMPGRDPAIT